MTEAEIRGKVNAFLQENFLYMRPDFVVGPDESLLRTGVIDSLGVMEIIGFVEAETGASVPEEDITADNFGTINAITRYIASRPS